METPSRALTLRRRRSSSNTNSPEFEFWRISSSSSSSSPSFPHSPLHSADELFSHGFLLPLHHLRPRSPSQPHSHSHPHPDPVYDRVFASVTSSAGNPILTASKRWKDLFKRAHKSEPTLTKSHKRKHKKIPLNPNPNSNPNSSSTNGFNSNSNSNSAELNINIWPFSRSHSAGNNASRSRPAGPSGRKVSSAPCSRSNSSGESNSSSRRSSWPNSPGRAGVHLGRSSPVWQLRRGKPAGKGRVLNLNVPMCMGYRQQLSCRSYDNGDVGCSRMSGGSNGNLFGLRRLFTKKTVFTA